MTANDPRLVARYHRARSIYNRRAGAAARVYNNKPELYEGLAAKARQSHKLMLTIQAKLKPVMLPSPDKYVLGECDSKSNRSYSS